MSMLCAVLSIQAQQRTSHSIIGMVLSAKDGAPLVSATVKIKNTDIGTITDIHGHFNLSNIDKDAVLVISSIGYIPQEVIAGKAETLTIRLIPSVNQLDETVIMGYGTTTQRLNTGDISTITAKEISEQPVTNVLAALSGRAPGVYVQTQNGLPGGDIQVQIRGRNSIGAGNQPLYVIDGVPYPATPLNSGQGNLIGANGFTSPLNSINPNDIQSIDILKDADATAIYGSRGANGVVLITTKKGKPGKTTFNINIHEGFSKLNMQGRYLNLPEYLELRREAFKNDGVEPTAATAPDLLVWDTTHGTNWQKYLFGRADHVTDVQASLSGGSRNTHFLLSGNFRRTGTIYMGDFHYARAGVHFNFSHTAENGKFSLSLTSSYTADKNNLPKLNFLSSLSLPPDFPLYDSSGNLNWNGGDNPLAVLKQINQAETNNLVSNLTLQYALLKGFDLKVSMGYNQLAMDQLATVPKSSQKPSAYVTNSANFGNISVQSYIIEPQINYTKKIGNGRLTALLGSTWQNTINTATYITGTNYVNEALLETISGAGSISYANNDYREYKYLSVFSRLNYNWKSKYIINGSFRRDGSSRFGPGKQFGNFGAMGIAWLFSNEPFVKNIFPFLSYGKLKSSYGITGNDQITDYQYLSTYSTGSIYEGATTLKPSRITNPDYSWETNKKLEASVELGFLKDKILLSAAWYSNKSSNQLVYYPLPSQTGFTSYQANLPALVRNTGWEFDLHTTNINAAHFLWNTSLNITFSKNKLVSFPGIAGSSYAFSYQVGEDLSIRKGYLFTGVDPKTGVAQFKDVNKDGSLDNADRVVIGKTSPDFYGGLNNTFTYKGIELVIFFQFAKQQNNNLVTAMAGMNNSFDIVLNRWQKPGDVTNIQKPTATPGTPAYTAYRNFVFSSITFSDASYVRLKNVSLSYRINSKWSRLIKMNELRIYLEAQNVLTWAVNNRYRLDPEISAQSVPPLKTFVMGFQFNF